MVVGVELEVQQNPEVDKITETPLNITRQNNNKGIYSHRLLEAHSYKQKENERNV